MTQNPGASQTNTPNYFSSVFTNQLLFILPFANLQLGGNQDQIFTKVFSGTSYDPQFITAIWKSGAAGGAPTGGIYPAPSRGGTGMVSSTQLYNGLTGALTHVNLTIQASTLTFTTTPYFNVNNPNNQALIAEFRIYGVCYD
jgi:hypothetical protein